MKKPGFQSARNKKQFRIESLQSAIDNINVD